MIATDRSPGPLLTLGVEEEFLIVDAATGALVGRGDELYQVARSRLGDDVAQELNLCQIETGTPVCTDLAGVRTEITRLRAELASAAASIGTNIAAAATHPFGSWRDQRIDPQVDRYRRIADVYQVVARQQVIAGCHVHVGIDDRDLAVAAMNRTRAWLPTLSALAANSPYWQGVDTGYASYRLQIWQRWPTSGMPPWLASAAEYDRVVDELIAMDAIEDATFIYWYVRPSARYPTLEFRPCDVCVDIDATVAVAGLVRAVAWTACRDVIEDRPAHDMGWEAHTAAMWRAARYGLDDQLVSPSARGPRPASEVVDELLDHVADGLAVHGDDEEVPALVAQILRDGNGAHRQRVARASDGNLRNTVHAVTVGTVDDPPAPIPTASDVEGPTHGFDVRVELSDLPNSLAQVASAVGQLQVNILDIHVHEIDGAVVDHILVEAPAATTADAIRAAVIAAGALQADVSPLSDDLDHDLGVRALEAAIRLVERRSLAEVVDCVGDVVPSDQASLEPIATLPVVDEDRTRLALGIPVSTSLPDATGGHHRAIVPRVGLGDIPFDALVVLRRSAPFSASEVARLRALLRLHASSVVEP